METKAAGKEQALRKTGIQSYFFCRILTLTREFCVIKYFTVVSVYVKQRLLPF